MAADFLPTIINSRSEGHRIRSVDVIGNVTCLEMTRPDQLAPGHPPPAPIELEEVGANTEPPLGSTYRRIWQPLPSGGRMAWSDEKWRAELERSDVRAWFARVRGTVAGLVELEADTDGDVGIVVFGLVPEFQGRGFGGAFLTLVTETAWSMGSPTGVPTKRIWLQTSSDDHPHALINYKRRGFHVFDTMALARGESRVGPWHVEPIVHLVHALLEGVDSLAGRPAVVAIDGRSSSGKTTLASRIARVAFGSTVIHTDDIAWWHSRFGWADLIIDGVLDPVRRGRPVRYRPPAWDAHGREGWIEVRTGTELLIVEGVGAGRRELTHLVDALIWVQCDQEEAEHRSVNRVGRAGGPATIGALRDWMAEETPFLDEQRPWERTSIIVAGAPTVDHDPRTEVVAIPGPAPRSCRS